MSSNHVPPRFAHQSPTQDRPPPLTMVTVAITHADPASSAFYASTELEMLLEWAKTGQFILALVATDRAELTLVCVDPVDAVAARVNQLPLVEAGIACADIRAVTTLRLDERLRLPPPH